MIWRDSDPMEQAEEAIRIFNERVAEQRLVEAAIEALIAPPKKLDPPDTGATTVAKEG